MALTHVRSRLIRSTILTNPTSETGLILAIQPFTGRAVGNGSPLAMPHGECGPGRIVAGDV